jgi:hypothetical protein
MFLSVGGGRPRIFSSGTSHGFRRRCFLMLMIGASGPPTLLFRGLRCCHVSHSSGSYLPAREAPTLPHVMWLWILPPYSRGLWRCHVSRGSRSYLPTWEGSGAATCLTTPNPSPCSGGLRRCHVSRSSLWAKYLKNKERLSWPTYAARLTCFQRMPTRY